MLQRTWGSPCEPAGMIAISLWHMSVAKPPFGLTTSLGAFYQAVFQREMDLIEMFPLMNQYKMDGGERDRITTCAGGMMPGRYQTNTLPWTSNTVAESEMCPHWGYGKYFVLFAIFVMGSENLSMSHSVTSSLIVQASEFYFPSVRTLTRVKDCIGNYKGRQLEFQGGNGCWGKDFLCYLALEFCSTEDRESLELHSTDVITLFTKADKARSEAAEGIIIDSVWAQMM
ncbi:hypothetical protein EDD16DRAFT_1527198 [Pisolithus croceorrhizus]|nr:hypothetical protein EV401DRAFT_1895563 [Pisolithus croceorrhizus]KAI6098427.1 hypothetical protein EDD16DRAFT_1527198 [Pisolithus croceorrhizus]